MDTLKNSYLPQASFSTISTFYCFLHSTKLLSVLTGEFFIVFRSLILQIYRLKMFCATNNTLFNNLHICMNVTTHRTWTLNYLTVDDRIQITLTNYLYMYIQYCTLKSQQQLKIIIFFVLFMYTCDCWCTKIAAFCVTATTAAEQQKGLYFLHSFCGVTYTTQNTRPD